MHALDRCGCPIGDRAQYIVPIGRERQAVPSYAAASRHRSAQPIDEALHGWRREAFGEDALRLKRGELALVLDGTRVRVVEVRRAAKAT